MADVMSNLRVRLEGARLIGLAAMNEGDAHEIPIPNSKADIGTEVFNEGRQDMQEGQCPLPRKDHD